MSLVIKYSSDNIVTPECCHIPEWDISLSCQDKNTISIAFYNDTAYCIFNGIHDIKHRENSTLEDYLELRLWTDRKILAIWITGKDNMKDILKRIQQKLLDVDYVANEGYEPISIDLSEYEIAFLENVDGTLNIVKCGLGEFYDSDFDVVDNIYERQYHILTPEQKERMKRSGRFKKHFDRYHMEGDKVWKDKIGDMDIAKYHLLIYGE